MTVVREADHTSLPPTSKLRPPDQVMRLARLGAAFPTRLSFARSMLRRLSKERASIQRTLWEIDEDGFGRAVYMLELGGRPYSLVAFATPLEDTARTDRVIAEAWDTTYALYDGVPDAAELERLQVQVPLQEAGRFTERELILSRANKSLRLFNQIVESLANGRQPDADLIGDVGYLMRTTAVYGNGKFGIADRHMIAKRPPFDRPFCGEMLTVWLIRGFTHDLVEHVARCRNPARAVALDRSLKRHLGIGNATGLGMAPFLANHPVLLHRWVAARETAIARCRAIRSVDASGIIRVMQLIDRAACHIDQWWGEDPEGMQRIRDLRREWSTLTATMDAAWWAEAYPFDRLFVAADRVSVEAQELTAALILEANGDLIDELENDMSDDAEGRFDPTMTVGELAALIDEVWSFARDADFADPTETARFWYVSEEKLEPRLGERASDQGADRELPLDIARRVQRLYGDLETSETAMSIGEFLLGMPEHRATARRVQNSAIYSYSEIHDNLISAQCEPIDMLRFKLAFFGATKFDPRSDRWTRITLFQGAPLFDELAKLDADDWWLPVLSSDS